MGKKEKFLPTFDYELQYAQQLFVAEKRPILVAGMDEVGRGSIAGPVAVGVAVRRFTSEEICSDEQTLLADLQTQMVPGLQDSKLLSAVKREALCPLLKEWVHTQVGMASAQEVDSWGILGGLRIASRRALAELAKADLYPDIIILDGVHNWFALPPIDLWQSQAENSDFPPQLAKAQISVADQKIPQVHCLVKGDQKSAIVAASSVVAKVERDALMRQLALVYPGYDFEHCMGYASKKHIVGIKNLGVCPEHRVSWKIPGI